jgi:hypothetical protein
MLKAVVAALALLMLAPAAAWPQSLGSPEIVAKTNAEMSALGRRMKTLEAIETDAMAQLDVVLNQMDVIVNMAKRKATPTQVQAWAGGWEPNFKSQVAAIRARVNGFPDVSVSDYPTLTVATAADGVDLPRLVQTVKRRKTAVLDILTMAETLAENEKQAASGDMAAMRRAGSGTLINLMALLNRENNNLDLAMASLPARNPNRDLAVSIRESNSAMVNLLQLAVDQVGGKPADPKATARDMRLHVKEGRTASNLMRDHAAEAVTSIQSSPGAQSDIGRKTLAIANTFSASADVELKLYSYIEGLAQRLDAGADPLDLFNDTSLFEKLVDERTKLQTDRTAMLAR